MSIRERATQAYKEELSPRSKLIVRRAFVGAVRACVRAAAGIVRLTDRTIELAVTHGLDLDRAWNVRPKGRPAEVDPFGSRDFLLLMNSLSVRKAVGPKPGAEVRTSVVIPVFNKADFTFQCLRSLVREVNFDETEIIIVDNASTDETPEMLSHFSGLVRVVRNEENAGFVDARNQGAAEARGRYLLFLNNDTVVQPGWLESLVWTVEDDPRVGAVGSMFVYPNGLVREAGATIWKDGGFYHYGWGRSPNDRRLKFAREVDYCSGASLLIRKELFDQLGGFDRRYAPAYYEDADLCFGVRSLGYKVIYQPASRVVHYEDAPPGKDTGAGFKRFQLVNREKFRDKWRELLEREQQEHDLSLAERAADRRRGPFVFVFDDLIPTPNRDAGSTRMVFILRALSEWSRVTFVPLGKQVPNEHENLLWKMGIETSTATEYHALLKEREPRAVVISRPFVAEALLKSLRRAAPRSKVIFDMVDAHFIRFGREAAITGDPEIAREATRFREMETRLARESDLIWCASSEDKRVMELEAPGVPAVVVPTIHRTKPRGLSFEDRKNLLFIGNFLHRPNDDGVRFFLSEVFPLVRERLPGVRFLVVGDNASPEVKAHASEDVLMLGYVPDVEPLLESSRVFVAPIRFGAGVKGKIGEALSHGIPVVTTSVGAEGMGFTDGREALIADDPRAFAEAIVRAYGERELWQCLSDEGHAHVERHFSPEVVSEIINDSVCGPSERKEMGAGETRVPPAARIV